MTPINALRKECERVRALAITSELVGNTHRAQLLDSVVVHLSVLADTPWNAAGIERLSEHVGEIADVSTHADVKFASREWYRSLIHIALALAKEEEHESVQCEPNRSTVPLRVGRPSHRLV